MSATPPVVRCRIVHLVPTCPERRTMVAPVSFSVSTAPFVTLVCQHRAVCHSATPLCTALAYRSGAASTAPSGPVRSQLSDGRHRSEGDLTANAHSGCGASISAVSTPAPAATARCRHYRPPPTARLRRRVRRCRRCPELPPARRLRSRSTSVPISSHIEAALRCVVGRLWLEGAEGTEDISRVTHAGSPRQAIKGSTNALLLAVTSRLKTAAVGSTVVKSQWASARLTRPLRGAADMERRCSAVQRRRHSVAAACAAARAAIKQSAAIASKFHLPPPISSGPVSLRRCSPGTTGDHQIFIGSIHVQ